MSSFGFHCKVGFFIRVVMIVYGAIQDEMVEVQYTDIDYKVFTDAARHVVNGNSPYDRSTYRYSPILAYALIPNIVIHPAWGKLLFSICDIFMCMLIRELLMIDKISDRKIQWSVFSWLYNPISIIISTRGNADSLSSVLVLGTLLALKKKHYLVAGVLHGISVHFRIYPIAFSLCMYLSIPGQRRRLLKSIPKSTQLLEMVAPTFDRLKLVLSCICTLVIVTTTFYCLYGYTFLYESLLYHLQRHDIRHNFSVYFYLQYLSSVSTVSYVQKLLTVLPQLVLLPTVSFVYGKSEHIYFCHLLIAFIMVTFNSVVTCQYFIWILCILPLAIPKVILSLKLSIVLIAAWVIAQLAWLVPAYLLEFKSRNTFMNIWVQGLVFFCVNVFVISKLIVGYRKRFKRD